MRGWILYKRSGSELTAEDHGVNRLCAAAASEGMHIDVYRPDQFDVLVRSSDTKTMLIDNVECIIPDFVIPRMGAETSYLALTIMRQLEALGAMVCNHSASIMAVKDKMHMSQRLTAAGLPTPKTLLVKFPVSMEMVTQALGFPVVIKTIAGAKGFGVFLCETASSLKDLMELMSTQQCLHGLILQEFVASSHGRDLRVFVVDGRIIGCMKRISTGGFKANYSLGGTVESFPLSAEIEDLSLRTAALFDLKIAGIDLLFKPKGFTICEANSSPGFKGMEKATTTDIAAQIIAYIKNQQGIKP